MMNQNSALKLNENSNMKKRIAARTLGIPCEDRQAFTSLPRLLKQDQPLKDIFSILKQAIPSRSSLTN